MQSFTHRVSLHLALTEEMAAALASDGIPQDRIRVHSNFVRDLGPYDGQRNGYVYVGRLTKEKGIGTLLAAWNSLGATAPPLTIVGEGPGSADVTRSGLSTIKYRGRLLNTEAMTTIAEAKALIFPSELHEGQGLTWIEALSRGTPVIYSDIGSLRSTLGRSGAGFAFNVGNAHDLARAVNEFESLDPQVRHLAGLEGRLFYEQNHDERQALIRLEDAYYSVLA